MYRQGPRAHRTPGADKTGIHVAEYLTVLPPKDVLQRKLQEAAAASRAHIESQRTDDE